MLSICKTITDLIDSLLTVESFNEDNISVPAMTGSNYANTTSGTIDISKDGYTPVGVVGARIANASSSGTNMSSCHWKNFYINGTTFNYNIANTCPGDANVRVYAWILYTKDR